MSAGPRERRRGSRDTPMHAQDGVQQPDQLPETTMGSGRSPEATGVQPMGASDLKQAKGQPINHLQQAGRQAVPLQRAAEEREPQRPAAGGALPAPRAMDSSEARAGKQTAARPVPAQAQLETRQPLAPQQRPQPAHTGTAAASTQASVPASVLRPPVYSPLGPPMPGKHFTALCGQLRHAQGLYYD